MRDHRLAELLAERERRSVSFGAACPAPACPTVSEREKFLAEERHRRAMRRYWWIAGGAAVGALLLRYVVFPPPPSPAPVPHQEPAP